MKTQDEKEKEIEKLNRLKSVIPATSHFGTNNHLVIDLQIEAINGTLTEDEVDEREHFEDEEEDETKDLSQEEAHSVREAFEWLNGDIDEVCSEDDIKNFTK